MKLAQLFSLYHEFKMGSDPMVEVQGLNLDSRLIKGGEVFFAIRGSARDSHDYLPEVCNKNIAGVVVEDASKVPDNFSGAVLVVKNVREAVVRLAGRYYGEPAEKLCCVGVTGTNGKTSTTYMVEAVLNNFGIKTGVMGTINHHCGEAKWESDLTTPDAVTLQKRLSEFLALGAKAAVFEVSSHAIDQNRILGVPLNCAIFTNLTRDHLDYHKTMENYFFTKEKLFANLHPIKSGEPTYAIININDPWGKKINVSPQAQRWTYGESQSDFQFQIFESSYLGTRFYLKTHRGDSEVKMKLPGRHNVYNAVAAIAAGMALGASLQSAVIAIEAFSGVPGRLERVPTKKDINVFIDYAHTDDALNAVLFSLNKIREQSKKKGKIITVFGCGGDRDKGKRPLMAKSAVDLSDLVYITSDNPRTEDPMAIIQDILAGVPKDLLKSKVFVEVERREAIRKAVTNATHRDAVIIAGKGHENFQIIGQTRHEFNDLVIAKEILNGL